MAVTQNTYTGNGSSTNYSFTFPYLETTDIKVSLDGSVTTAYTLANATTIQFNTAPANGVAIRIYRQTDDADLAAQFYPGSAIRSQDLNDNFTQNLYVTQESNREAEIANTTADSAVVTANSAVATANAATATANTASSNASAAVATANTASSNASAAVSTANTASSNATTAVNTANAASATATSAATDAATAISTANGAVTTANSAAADAATAVSTANTASSNASAAVSTANTASTNASTAVSTANSAVTTANNAVTTANSAVTTANAADSKADQAISAVANALLFTIVADVAAIPGSPSDGDAIEVTDSTGIESFTPLAGVPSGFVGDSGLGVRLVYNGTGSTWTWLQYFPQDPENRYVEVAGDTLTGALGVISGSAASPSVYFDANTGIYSPGADQVAISTNGTGRLFVDASGRVGVGTSPNRLLHIKSADPILRLEDNDPDGVYGQIDGSSGNLYLIADGGNSSASSFIAFRIDGEGSSSEKLRITSDGKLGLGTSTPNQLLDIKGATNYSSKMRFTGAAAAGYYADWGYNSDGNKVYLTIADNGSAVNVLTADYLGRVGIGTASPTHNLTLGSTAASDFVLALRGGVGGFLGWDDSANCTILQAPNTRSLQFRVNSDTFSAGTMAMHINSSGNVGIGTTSPGDLLHLSGAYGGGALRLEDSANTNSIGKVFGYAGGLYLQSRNNTNYGEIVFRGENNSGTTERARITSSGQLLVGTSTAPTANTGLDPRFVVSGNLSNTASGGTITLARGSAATSVNQVLGGLFFTDSGAGYFGTILCEADGSAGSGDYPGRLVFSTTADGASSPTERMRISNSGVVTIKNGAVAEIGTLTDGATITPNFAANCNFTVTLGGSRTIANPTNLTPGQSGSIFLVQDATGSRTVAWGSYWDFAGGTAPTLTTTANAVDRIDYIVRSSTSIHTVFTANYS